jgi:hypothetical protein
VPVAVAQLVQAQLLCDLRRVHHVRQVVLVREDEEDAVLHLPVVDDAQQLLSRLLDAVAVIAVDDEDEGLRARVVVSPERSDLVLSSDVLFEIK